MRQHRLDQANGTKVVNFHHKFLGLDRTTLTRQIPHELRDPRDAENSGQPMSLIPQLPHPGDLRRLLLAAPSAARITLP